ncbi:CPBP family glutamic-type intramembrane protease [Chryseobacterium foetidum]|uniref:CPBP family glutamic-type intramembrane protease n=1 Tax=Chryseobacterium foetidum TaxID=2951057 RepID=UPI0037C10AB0
MSYLIKFAFFADYFKFIFTPLLITSHRPLYRKISETFFIYLFCLILSTSISIAVYYFIDTPQRKAEHIDLNFGYIFLSCFFLPLIEEIVFRLSLIYSRCNLSFTTAGLFFLIINNFLKTRDIFIGENYYLIRIISSLMISILIGIIFYFAYKKYEGMLAYFFENNFRTVFYISSLIFAFLHISNFQISLDKYLVYPLIILPQLIFGLTAGFIRIKYGFLYCLSVHILNNLIPTLIIYLYFL